jgi:CDGSH-type Zn-finger protein
MDPSPASSGTFHLHLFLIPPLATNAQNQIMYAALVVVHAAAGASNTERFCDGTHCRTGFKAADLRARRELAYATAERFLDSSRGPDLGPPRRPTERNVIGAARGRLRAPSFIPALA